MSYTTLDRIHNLHGKNVLFLDLETTGLPNRKYRNKKPQDEYYEHTNNKAYDSSRIVQIAFCLVEDFCKDFNINRRDIKTRLVYPNNFVIPEKATEIHGITTEDIKTHGIKMDRIMEKGRRFRKFLEKCDAIIAYNVFFDVSILKNELYRYGLPDLVEKILSLEKTKKVFCLGQLSRRECCPNNWEQYYYYQIPRQRDVYFKCFGVYPKDEHDAKGDVYAMLKIMKYILNMNKENILET